MPEKPRPGDRHTAPVKLLLRMSTTQRERLRTAVKKLNDEATKPGQTHTLSKFILDAALEAADKITGHR
jgi:uncharacterized protein (DUF1778 family)